ncbi:M23 family metallopeptidase [Desulfovibrio sp. OttesenSCG-928-C06]|nr:M23 family metallopeptidase [Desulfovibrio sp. OttesenSCG-928-C06]
MQKKNILMAYAFAMLTLVCLGIAYIVSMEHDAPEIIITPFPSSLTENSELEVLLYDRSSGIKSVEISVIINGKPFPILTESYAGKHNSRHLRFNLKHPAITGKSGNIEGTLRIKATDHSTANWWNGNSSSLDAPFCIDADPPQSELLGISSQVRRGGSAAVAFRASEPLQSALVRIGPHEFTAFEQTEQVYACIFAFPLELPLEEFKPELVLTDKAGNTSTSPLETAAVEHEYREDNIQIGQNFITGKFAEFSLIVPDENDPLRLFLRMNRQVRQSNYAELAEERHNTAAKPLWDNDFMELPNSVRRGLYGDRRVYINSGTTIDRQIHKGIDLASYRHDNVPAVSSGTVLMAGYLGIHGNMVLLDHGLGVQSLYSHLSRVGVAQGQQVTRGQTLGLTGTSGMAGGDHLHFEILVGGHSVEPDDWLNQPRRARMETIINQPPNRRD